MDSATNLIEGNKEDTLFTADVYTENRKRYVINGRYKDADDAYIGLFIKALVLGTKRIECFALYEDELVGSVQRKEPIEVYRQELERSNG